MTGWPTLALTAAIWLACAAPVGLLIGRAVRRRDQQVSERWAKRLINHEEMQR